ncbi:MAG: energy transducer TonB [Colwellia sp.]|jgi:protein TonB
MKKALLILSLASILMSCASTNAKQEKKEYLDLTNDYDQSTLAQYWKVSKRVDPKYPINAARQNISGCVEVLIGINEKGEVDGYKINKSYPKRVFDQSTQAALMAWKYEPTKENVSHQPVLTLIQMDFQVKRSSTDDSFEKHCVNKSV